MVFDATQLSSLYYFAPQQHTGVWDDFGYLDTDTNIKLDYYKSDNDNNFGLFGEGFYGNWFVTIEHSDLSEADNFSAGIGYLFADSLKVSMRLEEFKTFDTIYCFKGQYNHQLNDTDYVGFTIETDDEIDVWELSSRYFAHVNNGSYFAVDVSYNDNNVDSTISGIASYYFSRHFALGAGANDSNLLLEAKYFINSQYYFTANYNALEEGDLYSVKFAAQF